VAMAVDARKGRLYACTGVFFVFMLLMELALEHAGRIAKLRGISAPGFACTVSLSQFTASAIVPLVFGNARLGKVPRTFAGLRPYCAVAALVFGATGLATAAVLYVPYPVKVVGKSTKLVFTMAVATLFHGATFQPLQYAAAALVCAGAVGFAWRSPAAGTVDGAPASAATIGALLLFASVACDAFVSNLQKRVLDERPDDGGADQLVTNTNCVGASVLLVYVLLAEPHTLEAVKSPDYALALLAVGSSLGVAVCAYTRLIEQSSAVAAVTVATLRKIATVVLSYVFFPKPFTATHIVSGLCVAAGVFLAQFARDLTPRTLPIKASSPRSAT